MTTRRGKYKEVSRLGALESLGCDDFSGYRAMLGGRLSSSEDEEDLQSRSFQYYMV